MTVTRSTRSKVLAFLTELVTSSNLNKLGYTQIAVMSTYDYIRPCCYLICLLYNLELLQVIH
jgi:hypothetical protein